MEPYEGREPYIFISYARKDAERATPFLDALSGAGYRFWYDKGIEAGADWLKKLFAKVEGCEVFCPLFSEAFQDSRYCFVETAWAYQNNKNIVPLYLEELNENNFRRFYQLLRKLQALPLYQFDSAARFAEWLARERVFTQCKAPEWNKIGQIQWHLSADGVLEIATNEDIIGWHDLGSIPPYQEDIIHHCGATPWMPYREKILSVAIKDDIYVIGECAFHGCASLTNVRMGENVTEIGDCAFEGCKSLVNVRIPDSVTEIGDCAFEGCESLTNVRIGDSVTEIGSNAFYCCKNLTNVRIPDSVVKIGFGAFARCGLTDVSIGDGVTVIGEYAFDDCVRLKSVEVPRGAEVAENAFPERTRVTRREAAQS